MSTPPYARSLNNGLILKSIHDPNDADRIAQFNHTIFGEGVAMMSHALIQHHPAAPAEQWLYIEDEASGKIVSSLVLITWQWRYEDVLLKSGEVGIVGTDPAYRNRGLIRTLFQRHHELLREGEYDLSHIQGIGYFYRQFGYEYAIPLEPEWNIELRNMPDLPADTPYQFRLATVADIPDLMRMYEAATCPLNITNIREAGAWEFMLLHSAGSELEGEIWLILDGARRTLGYFRVGLFGFGTGLIVSETSRLPNPMAQHLLGWLKAAAIERAKPYVRLNLPVSSDLMKAGRTCGMVEHSVYEWQLHVVDWAQLFTKLGPVLERRLAASPLAGLSQTVILNFYREAFALEFEQGRLMAVKSLGFCDEGEIRIPALPFIKLLMGQRSREELRYMYPDVAVWGQSRQIVDVLFPKMDAFIFTNY